MKMRVYKDGWDWIGLCPVHDSSWWAGSQADAYECLAGHAVMHHPKSPK